MQRQNLLRAIFEIIEPGLPGRRSFTPRDIEARRGWPLGLARRSLHTARQKGLVAQESSVDPEGGPWQISAGVGFHPLWSPTGKEIFYRSPQGLMTVQVETEGDLRVLGEKLLFADPYYSSAPRTTYDVTADGQRFLMITAADAAATGHDVVLVENWFEELKRRVPTD